MNPKLQTVKTWFEIFYYAVIGVTGIILSVIALSLNSRELELRSDEISMRHSEMQPVFRVEETYDSYKKELNLYNDGAPARNVYCKPYTFLPISGYDNYIYLENFHYNNFIASTKNTGLVATSYSYGNLSWFDELINHLYSTIENPPYYSYSDLIEITEIFYKDIYEKNRRYWFNKNRIIEPSQKDELLEKSYTIERFTEISDINPHDFWTYLKTKGTPKKD